MGKRALTLNVQISLNFLLPWQPIFDNQVFQKSKEIERFLSGSEFCFYILFSFSFGLLFGCFLRFGGRSSNPR